MITQSSILSSQVKTRMICLSILSTCPTLTLTVVSPGLVHNTCIRESYMSLPLSLERTCFKFLPSKKRITRLPLNQGPAAAMVRHPAAHEEFLPSMSWIFFHVKESSILGSLHRAQIIHHFYLWVMSSIGKWFISLSNMFHLHSMLLSFEPSSKDISSFHMVGSLA